MISLSCNIWFDLSWDIEIWYRLAVIWVGSRPTIRRRPNERSPKLGGKAPTGQRHRNNICKMLPANGGKILDAHFVENIYDQIMYVVQKQRGYWRCTLCRGVKVTVQWKSENTEKTVVAIEGKHLIGLSIFHTSAQWTFQWILCCTVHNIVLHSAKYMTHQADWTQAAMHRCKPHPKADRWSISIIWWITVILISYQIHTIAAMPFPAP